MIYEARVGAKVVASGEDQSFQLALAERELRLSGGDAEVSVSPVGINPQFLSAPFSVSSLLDVPEEEAPETTPDLDSPAPEAPVFGAFETSEGASAWRTSED